MITSHSKSLMKHINQKTFQPALISKLQSKEFWKNGFKKLEKTQPF